MASPHQRPLEIEVYVNFGDDSVGDIVTVTRSESLACMDILEQSSA